MQEYSKDNIIELKKLFYDSLIDNTKIPILEKYIYDSEWIKLFIGDDDYLDLICMDFKAKSIIYDLSDIFKKTIGLADYEQELMINTIKEAMTSREKLPDILMLFYSQYCHGYTFFEDLGLGYGLCCQVPQIDGRIYDYWDDINIDQKNRIIDSFFPNIENDLQRALDWFSSGRIRFTEEYNEYKLPKFVDVRTDEEKRYRVWTPIKEDKNIIKNKNKSWWKKLTTGSS